MRTPKDKFQRDRNLAEALDPPAVRSRQCTCLTIMNDPTRHFKECPDRREILPNTHGAHIVDRFDVYMVLVSQASGCVFVKALDFFRSQGGFREGWGRSWVPIVAESIEDARELGCKLPGAKPYSRQAKP